MKAKWTLLCEKIMSKRHAYSNMYSQLRVPDTIGCVLAGVNPSLGYFGDTSALSKGVQLKEHHSKIRSLYNTVLQKLDKSGFHSAHEELLRATYDRTTEGNKVKDMGLFFYCLTVKDKDLDFLSSVLDKNETGEEIEEEGGKKSTETDYGKRQRFMKEREAKTRTVADERQIAMMRSVMTPDTGSSFVTDELNKSIVAKNQLAVLTSEKHAVYLASLTAGENIKTEILEMNNIKALLSDPNVLTYISMEDVTELKSKLRRLMKLPSLA